MRVFVSLPASLDTSYHVRLGFVDQLVGQTLETIGQGRSLYRLYLPRFRRTTGTNHFDAMRDDLDKSIVVLPELAKQFDFILCHELQPIDVIAELVKLAKRARQRRLVRRKQSGGNAVELAYCVMLDLPIGFDLALQPDKFLSALIDAAENLESDGPHHDEQHRNCEKCRKQFDLYASRDPRNHVRPAHPSSASWLLQEAQEITAELVRVEAHSEILDPQDSARIDDGCKKRVVHVAVRGL